jgi:hypothetical protein
MHRFARAVLGSLLALLLLAGPAAAHQGNPDFRSVLNGFSSPTPGLTAQVISYDSYLQLTNKTGKTVTIYGYQKEPMARMLPDGTVQTNQRSPSLYLDADRFGAAPVPASADATAPPQWKTLDGTGQYTWHDHRMHWMARTTPPQVKDKHKKTKIFDYQVPVQVGDAHETLNGTLFWVGPSSTSKLPFIIIGILVAGLLVATVIRNRRRNRPAASGPSPAHKEAW